MRYRFNPPPNWPPLPYPQWTPPPGWQPSPAWGPPPPGWRLWTPVKIDPTGLIIGALAFGMFVAAVIGVAVDHGGTLPTMTSEQFGYAIGQWIGSWKGLVAASVVGTPAAVYYLVKDYRHRHPRPPQLSH